MTEADGTLVVEGDIALVRFERRLSHPVQAVWAALTEPEQLAVWLGPGKLEPHAGGEIAVSTGPEGQARLMSGRILEWVPEQVLEYEWRQPGLDVSVVRYELEADAAGTKLRFSHRRSVTPAAIGGRAGWHAFLDRLTAHLDGAPVPSWATRRGEVQAVYEEAPLPGT